MQISVFSHQTNIDQEIFCLECNKPFVKCDQRGWVTAHHETNIDEAIVKITNYFFVPKFVGYLLAAEEALDLREHYFDQVPRNRYWKILSVGRDLSNCGHAIFTLELYRCELIIKPPSMRDLIIDILVRQQRRRELSDELCSFVKNKLNPFLANAQKAIDDVVASAKPETLRRYELGIVGPEIFFCSSQRSSKSSEPGESSSGGSVS